MDSFVHPVAKPVGAVFIPGEKANPFGKPLGKGSTSSIGGKSQALPDSGTSGGSGFRSVEMER